MSLVHVQMRERTADDLLSADLLKHMVQHIRDGDAVTMQLLHATCRVSPPVCQAACLAGIAQVLSNVQACICR